MCNSNEAVQQLQGGKNVKILFEMFKGIPPRNIERVEKVYGDSKWKVDPAEFDANNAAEIKKFKD